MGMVLESAEEMACAQMPLSLHFQVTLQNSRQIKATEKTAHQANQMGKKLFSC
jgi:hypothetical protein